MILVNGITGFNHGQKGPLPIVDGMQFKTICFSAITKNGGSVVSFDEPEIATNFYKVQVDVFDEQLYIVLNRHYPFIAFASSLEYGSVHFIDHHQLAQGFSPYYRILTALELHEPLVISDRKGKKVVNNANDLNDDELQQIRYWRPERVGEVIFNIWD